MDDTQARELLERARKRVEHSLAELVGTDDDELSHLPEHQADDATPLHDKELDEGIADQRRDELAAIERAERRLAEGTYGLSIESGEPIPDARLEAIPWAERTIEEQTRLGR
jgi:DnaK suppressor protein